jgi:hypothetical protein
MHVTKKIQKEHNHRNVKLPNFVNYKNGCTPLAAQVIKFTSCLPMVGGSLQVLQFLPPLKLFAMINVKIDQNQIYPTSVCDFLKVTHHIFN